MDPISDAPRTADRQDGETQPEPLRSHRFLSDVKVVEVRRSGQEQETPELTPHGRGVVRDRVS